MFKRISRSGIEIGTLSWSMAALFFIVVISFWHLFYVRLSDDNWKNVIRSDGAGYYAYLPATFIYHDLTYKFAEEKSKTYQCEVGCDIHFFASHTLAGKRINKYFIGTSIMELPFFIAAWSLSSVFGYSADGYSFLFQAFICLAAIFYLLAGLYCVRKLLLKMNLKDKTIAIVLLLLFFGTNIYHYALEEPSMSHIYSFAAISFFLLTAFQLSQEYSRKNLILLTLTFAIIVLIRPANGIIILTLPFFISNLADLKNTFKKIIADKKGIPYSVILIAALFFLQSLVWKFTTGNWLEDSYAGEKLNPAHPHIGTIFFGWRKGFFIYTPLMLIGVAGLFFIRPIQRAVFLTVFIFINTWIIASWHDLAYGGSLGMRPFVDTYAVFAIPLAFLIEAIRNNILKISVAVIMIALVFLNLFQHYQYHLGILPYDEMTWTKYKKIFLHSEKVYSGIFAPGSDGLGDLPEGCKLVSVYKRNFDNDTNLYLNQAGVVKDKIAFSKPSCAKLVDSVKYCADLFVFLNSALPDSWRTSTTNLSDGSYWVKVKAKVWMESAGCDAKMVISFKDNNQTYSWNGFYLVHRIDKTKAWCDYSFAIPMQKLEGGNEMLSVYVLKDDNTLLYIDDLEISFWEK
jgi:hypothetical protein